MKKILFLTAFFFIAVSAFSQSPTLTQANNAFAVGDNYVMYSLDTTGVIPGVSGANVIWTFTNLSMSGAQSISSSIVTPSSTPNGASFPGSTVAISVGGMFEYLGYTSSSCSTIGADDGAGSIIYYSNPMTNYTYPFTYNSSSNDNFASNFSTSGLSFSRSGNMNTTADAWGKLILPGKTYNNTLRVKMIQTVTDICSYYTMYTTITTYSWFDAVLKSPILQISLGQASYSIQPGVILYFKSVALNGAAVGVEDYASNDLNLKVYPNPAKDNITIESKINKGMWEIVDITGKQILSDNITENSQIIKCDKLINGIYMIRLTDEKGLQTTQKILINK